MSFFDKFETAIAGFAKKIASLDAKVSPIVSKVESYATTIETVSGIVLPASVAVEQTAFALLGKVTTALQGADAAAQAGGINIKLDEAELTDLKAVVGYLTSHPLAPGAVKK
jgi:hypothetical protein